MSKRYESVNLPNQTKAMVTPLICLQQFTDSIYFPYAVDLTIIRFKLDVWAHLRTNQARRGIAATGN